MGGEERHRQPVLELRILALHANAQRVLVERFGARERVLPEIEERQIAVGRRQALAQRLVGGDDPLAVLLEADDVVGHRRERRRLDARRGKAPDRVHVVVGDELARARLLEVGDLVLVGDVLALHVVIQVFALRVLGERRVRRELDARLQLDDELRFRDVLARAHRPRAPCRPCRGRADARPPRRRVRRARRDASDSDTHTAARRSDT